MDQHKGLRCYTDGSNNNVGVGAGFCIAEHDKILRARAYGVSKSSTVLQAEIKAIELAATELTKIITLGGLILIAIEGLLSCVTVRRR